MEVVDNTETNTGYHTAPVISVNNDCKSEIQVSTRRLIPFLTDPVGDLLASNMSISRSSSCVLFSVDLRRMFKMPAKDTTQEM